MSTLNPTSGHAHDPHLAHHFHSHEQQYQSGKLGMWVFLSTEILMFGGLFCAYSVYRHNHPEVFEWAHLALDRKWGAINTVILLASSLTMAWAVRAAMLGSQKVLRACLLLTILGGLGFMGIKFVEYKAKWEHHLWFGGSANIYSPEFDAKAHPNIRPDHEVPGGHLAGADAHGAESSPPAVVTNNPSDPNRLVGDGADAAKIFPMYQAVGGLSPDTVKARREHPSFDKLEPLDRQRVFTFFQIYFCMTGLHGIHVLVGMGLIGWILLRAIRGDFGPGYFAPVDLVGLYWHLVDLIWIFLFPLLYLIH